MGPLVETVVELALSLTAEARHVAFVQFEGQLTTLGPKWDDLNDDHALNSRDIIEALQLSVKHTPQHVGIVMDNNKIPCWKRFDPIDGQIEYYIRKSDLYHHLQKKSFHGNCRPREGYMLPLHKLLFVMRYKQGLKSHGRPGTARQMNYNLINRFLNGSLSESSVFKRNEMNVGKITTHMPRFFVNTLAQHYGLGDLDIAHWMGRRKVESNKVYDLRPHASKTAEMRNRLEDNISTGLARMPKIDPLLSNETLVGKGEAWHATTVGVCSHDYAATPCPLYMAMVKAGFDQSADVRIVESRVEAQLADAKMELAAGTYGAGTWVEAQQATLDAVRCWQPRNSSAWGTSK